MEYFGSGGSLVMALLLLASCLLAVLVGEEATEFIELTDFSKIIGPL